MEKKDKINFDLDFLDSDVKEKPKQNPNNSKDPNWVFHDGNNNPAKDYTTGPSKKWFWVAGAVGLLIIVGIISGDSSSSTPSSSSSNNGQVQVGNYMCSSYEATQVDNLAPNSFTKSSLSSDRNQLDTTSTSLDRERSEIDSEYVDEYDQYSLDQHNQKVDEYNIKLRRYKNDLANYNNSLDAYNATVDTYNNYLQAHCTPN